ncbi:hypothetical protein [Nocardia sp. alder85J]|nr:hypothetical protein [Nocardia sp. alder85J]MCX4095686.1 hypothetical protein [Nocardia sp. alder85J]
MAVRDLFDGTDTPIPVPRVLMSLHAQYYDLMWNDLKFHEFRKR